MAARPFVLAVLLICVAGCRAKARTPGADAHADIAAVSPEDARGDAGALGRDEPRASLALRCAFDGPDRRLAPLWLTRMRIAAHGDEAMLVAEHTSSFAPEPAGDSVDEHASRWWRFDRARPERDTAAAGERDSLDVQRERGDGGESTACEYAKWSEDAERPVWRSSGWSRWRHASSWGGPACSPCGTLRDVDAPGARPLLTTTTTDVMRELEVSVVDGFVFGAALLHRYEDRGPADDTRNVCGEAEAVIESLLPEPAGFARSELSRARIYNNVPDLDDEPLLLAVAATNVGDAEGAIVTVHGADAQRIKLRRVDRAGRSLGEARALHVGRNIGVVGAAYIRSRLVVVWSESPTPAPDSRASLRWLWLDPRTPGASSSSRVLREPSSGTIDQLALSSDGETAALLWVERPARGPSEARLAVGGALDVLAAEVSAGGIAVAQASRGSSLGTLAVAVARERVWCAFGESTRNGDARPRVRSLRCVERDRDR